VILNNGMLPGRKWRWARRLTQAVGLFALFLGPLLGGWLRLAQRDLAAWRDSGSDLPPGLATLLPYGTATELIRHIDLFRGGGIAADYLSIPLMDPLAGALAMLSSHITWRALLALALPILIAVLAGRVFCGWLCPFGVFARGIDRLLDRLSWQPRWQIPSRRPMRWVVLGGAIIASLLGVHLLLYLSLPYLLLQQAVYAGWLLGGGSAVLAVLLGLLVAGLLLGPTSYCATLCPTGATLSLLGRLRPLRLGMAAPSACGAHCNLCNEACWLHLDPASGDAGPDCDLCMRCVATCPRSNLRVTVSKTFHTDMATPLIWLTVLCSTFLLIAPPATADAPMRKPRLLLEREHTQGAVTLSFSVVDFTGVTLDADARQPLEAIEVSLFLARGKRGAADARGLLPRREVYRGPLTLQLKHAASHDIKAVQFEAPTSPISTVERTIYRQRLNLRLVAGDHITLMPVTGWLEQPITWAIPSTGATGSPLISLQFFVAAAMIFGGVLSLAFAFSGQRDRILKA
jgi:ferredoxin-type protein NapH